MSTFFYFYYTLHIALLWAVGFGGYGPGSIEIAAQMILDGNIPDQHSMAMAASSSSHQGQEHTNEKADFPKIERDVLSGDQPPKLSVCFDFYHPILSNTDNVWCGADPDENVYDDPYTAELFLWETDIHTWNTFQSKCKSMSYEERSELWAMRARDVDQQKAKRKRCREE